MSDTDPKIWADCFQTPHGASVHYFIGTTLRCQCGATTRGAPKPNLRLVEGSDDDPRLNL